MAETQPGYDENAEPEGRHLLDHLDVLLRRWRLIVAVFVTVTAFATVRSFMTRSVYEARVQIVIQPGTPNVLDFKEVTEVTGRGADYLQTQIKLLQSRILARRTIESLGLLQDPEFGGPRDPKAVEEALAAEPGVSPMVERAIDVLLSRLRVQAIKDSQIVLVGFESFRPDLSAQVANELSKKYIEQTLEFRYETSSEAAAWLASQIEEQERKVGETEAALQQVKERDGIVNIEERRVLLNQKLTELGSSLNGLKTATLQKEALWRQMSGAESSDELPEVMSNSVVQNLRSNLANLQQQEAELLQRYLEQHPSVLKIRRQIEETREKMHTEALAVIRSAENSFRASAAQTASVEAALEATKAEILDLSKRAVQYDNMKRELDASKQVLDSLLSRHKETDVAQALKTSNIRIVDAAVVPRWPARPNRPVDIGLGVVIGLGLGLGLAFFLDYLDNTIRTPLDVREHLRSPLLAVIPEAENKTGPVLLASQHAGSFAEGYRVLRTSLNYAWPSRDHRIVLVTSTSPGEGKTVTAVNLALALASSGTRVLLVDADMRRPQVQKMLSINKRPGLTDVLVGQSPPSEAIRTVTGTNLSVMPSGTTVPSPADLMTTEVIEGLLRGLRETFGWVVIDTPPVAAVADALMLGRYTDGVVVVAGAEMVPRGAVKHTLERILAGRARVLGVVLNRLQARRGPYQYGHYYGHYYDSYYGRPDETEAKGDKVARFRRDRPEGGRARA